MTETEAIQAQTTMLAAKFDVLNSRVDSLQLSINALTQMLTAPVGVLSEALGRLYWLLTILACFVLAYVILRVLWANVFRPILHY